jgi:hypothetical protein
MNILDEMSFYWSQQVAKGIADKTIILLESKNELLYDSDSCLTNNWEGLCVQLQDERSVMDWDRAIEVIHSFLHRYYEALPKEEQFTLWTQTDAGQEWYANNDNKSNDTFEFENAPSRFEDCIKLLMTVLLEKAIAFKNDNIINYIDFDCNGIEYEDDEYKEEDEEYDE